MTTRMRLLVFLVALSAMFLALATPVFGTEEENAETTPAAEVTVDVPAPAILIEEDPAEEATPEWTFRFLIPVTLLIGGLSVVGTIIAYFVKVTRQRYRIVE